MNAKTMKTLTSSKFQDWATPPDFFAWLHAAFDFEVDACASDWNHKLKRYWSIKDDGLKQNWDGLSLFYNPRYEDTEHWVARARVYARHYATLSAGLLAARVGVKWWTENVSAPAGKLLDSYYHVDSRVWWHCWSEATIGFYFHDRRLEFGHPDPKNNGSPFDSAVVIMAPPRRAAWRPKAKTKPVNPKSYERYREQPLLSAGAPW